MPAHQNNVKQKRKIKVKGKKEKWSIQHVLMADFLFYFCLGNEIMVRKMYHM